MGARACVWELNILFTPCCSLALYCVAYFCEGRWWVVGSAWSGRTAPSTVLKGEGKTGVKSGKIENPFFV